MAKKNIITEEDFIQTVIRHKVAELADPYRHEWNRIGYDKEEAPDNEPKLGDIGTVCFLFRCWEDFNYFNRLAGTISEALFQEKVMQRIEQYQKAIEAAEKRHADREPYSAFEKYWLEHKDGTLTLEHRPSKNPLTTLTAYTRITNSVAIAFLEYYFVRDPAFAMDNEKVKALLRGYMAEAINQSESDVQELALTHLQLQAYFATAYKRAMYYELLLEEGALSIHADEHKAVVLRKELAYWEEESKRFGAPKFFSPVDIGKSKSILQPSYLLHFEAFCTVRYLKQRIAELEAPAKHVPAKQEATTSVFALALWYRYSVGLLPELKPGEKGRKIRLFTLANELTQAKGIYVSGQTLYQLFDAVNSNQENSPKHNLEHIRKAAEELAEYPNAQALALKDIEAYPRKE